MLLVDTHNLFNGSMQVHGQPVDYQRLEKFLSEKYNDPFVRRFAYIAKTENSRSFETFLYRRLYIVRTKEIRVGKMDSFDVDLSLDALDCYDERRVIICSSSPNLLPLIKALDSSVGVHAFGIPHVIRQACFTEELPRKVLRDGVAAAI